jgi:hypothetical protein
LNGTDGGLVLHATGDLGIIRLEKQLTGGQNPNIVHVAAHLGLKHLLHAACRLLMGAIYKRQALTAAAVQGHVDIVRVLAWDQQTLVPPGGFVTVMNAAPTGHISTVTALLRAAKRYETGDRSETFPQRQQLELASRLKQR